MKKKDKEPINEPVIEIEANEFLKFIKHNEYSIIEQLHKLSAKISLLALMLSSEPHREAMLKVLKQAYVPHNVPIEKIDHLVGNIMKREKHHGCIPSLVVTPIDIGYWSNSLKNSKWSNVSRVQLPSLLESNHLFPKSNLKEYHFSNFKFQLPSSGICITFLSILCRL